MNAGCTGYIYWYMRAHWAFVGTGEAVEINGKKINIAGNTKNKLLPRAFVMSHFSKHVTGATRLKISGVSSSATDASIQASAYIKGDSLIVMAINATKGEHNIKLSLPVKVKSGIHLLSTGNETENLCQESPITIDEPTKELMLSYPAKSLSTYIFTIQNAGTAIQEIGGRSQETGVWSQYYDLQGRRLSSPSGLCIERSADGSSRKVFFPSR
jgi:glucuronoarabinoxylan endo-1,4-beta-xylanase